MILLAGFLQAQAGPERNVPVRSKSDGLAFMENKGQVVDNLGNQRPDILYTAQNHGVQVYFRQNALSYVFPQVVQQDGESVVTNVYRTDVEFVGANSRPEVVAEGASGVITNFYLSNSNLNGIQARSYRKLTYHNLYEGIDLVFFASEQNGQSTLKYEFVVRPGANPNVIRMRQVAAQKVSLTRDGNLVVSNPLGQIEEVAPFTFQTINGTQQVVASAYEVKNGVVSFRLGQYDRNEPLVIDPLTRQWATNVGGSVSDRFNAVSTDANGNAYAVGQTNSVNFPVNVGPSKVADNSQDVVLARFNSNGSLAWATYYGGNGVDIGSGVTQNGNAVSIVGWTGAQNLPVSTNALQPTNAGGFDAFIAQFDANTGQFVWGTYVGGPLAEQFTAIQAAANGDLYVAGRVQSTNLATAGAAQVTPAGNRDMWVGRFTSAGALSWGTYYGGTNDDQATGIALGDNNDVYVTGSSVSNGLSTAGAFQTTNNGLNDVLVVKFNSSGVRQWATYYGGAGTDVANGIAFSNGNVFVVGQTTSSAPSFSVPVGSYQTQNGGLTDAFLFALNGANGNRIMATFIGGNGTDIAFGVSTVGNNVYVAGTSNSNNFNVINPNAVNLPFQATNAGFLDKFIAKFDATAPNNAQWSILYGGSTDDAIRAISSNSSGVITAVGYSNSPNFPVFNRIPQQTATPGLANDDATIIRLTDDVQTTEPCIVIGSIAQGIILCGNQTTTLNVLALYGGSGTLSYTLTTASGTLTSTDGLFSNVPAGAYTLTVTDGNPGCTVTQTGSVQGPSPLTFTVTATNEDCQTSQLGSISVDASGGTPGYTYSIDGGVFQPQATFAGLSAGTYSIRVRDNNGCLSAATPVVISTNAPVLSVVSQTSPRCAGDLNGSIMVNVTGGTAPFQFAVNAGLFTVSAAPMFTFNGLGGGTQTIQVLDANGCSSLITAELANPAPIVVNPVVVNPTSCTMMNGSLTLNVSGGTAPYTYSFDNGASFGVNNSRTNLGNATLATVVRDANGCEVRQEVVVSSADAPVIESVIRINPSCRINNTTADGQVVILASGAASPLFYSLQNGAPGTFFGSFTGSYTFAGLTAGTYNVAVANDAMGTCITRATVTLVAPPALIIDRVTRTQPSCGSASVGGSLTISAVGGVPPYSYSIDGGQSFSPNPTFSNLFPVIGGYPVMVMDANGCRSNGGTYFIFNPSGLAIANVQETAPNCGQSNGSITVVPMGGTLPRFYSINGGMETSSTATSFTFSNLTEGVYRIRIRDNSGCIVEEEVSLVTLSLNLSSTPSGCNAAANAGTGTITATINGGTGPFVYSITGTYFDGATLITSPTNWFSSSAINATQFIFGGGTITGFPNGLPAGVYTITVRDLSSTSICLASGTISIGTTPSTLPRINSFTVTQPACAGGNGSVVITGAANPDGNTYYLLGSSTLGPVTGTGAGQITGTFNNIVPAGTFVPVIRQTGGANAGCLAFGSPITLTAPDPIVISNVEVRQPACDGSLGRIVITATGSGPLEYTISGTTNWQSSNVFENLNPQTIAAGNVRVRYASATTCFVSTSQAIVLTNPSAFTFTTATTPQNCAQPNGTITATVTGGTAPYRFFIDGVEATTAPQFSNIFTFTKLSAGTHIIRVVDATGNCPAVRSQAVALGTIFDFATNAITAVTQPTCNDGQFTVNTVGGNTAGTRRFSINNGGSFTNVTLPTNNATFSNLPAGNYRLVVIDQGGCRISRDYTLTGNNPGIFVNSISFTNPPCVGQNGTISISFSVSGAAPIGVTAANIGGNPATTNPTRTGNGATTSSSSLPAGTYALELVTDANVTSCPDLTITLPSVTLTDPPALIVQNVAVTQPVCGTPYQPASITVTASGGSSSSLLYSIDNGTTFQSSPVFNPVDVRRGTPATNVFRVVVRDPTLPVACNTAVWGANPFTISNPSGLDISSGTLVQPTCVNSPTGRIPVTIAANTYPVQLVLSMGNTQVQTVTLNSGTSHLFQNLVPGMYTVRAIDASNCEDFFTATLTAPAPLEINVTGTTAPSTCSQVNNNGSFVFSVTGGVTTPTNQREYRITANGVVQPGPNANGYTDIPTAGGPFTINNLSSGIYQIEVRNKNNTACNATRVVLLNDVSTPTFNNAVVLPAGNTACNNGVLEARFTGTGPNLMYEISPDGGFSWSAPQTSRLFLNLPAGTYFVRARTGSGPNYCYSFSNAIVVGCTSQKGEASLEATKLADLSVYPNPNNGQFTVNYTTTAAASVAIKVIDLTGKEILSTTRELGAGENLIDLNIDNAAAGIYLLQVIDGGEVRTVKVAKN